MAIDTPPNENYRKFHEQEKDIDAEIQIIVDKKKKNIPLNGKEQDLFDRLTNMNWNQADPSIPKFEDNHKFDEITFAQSHKLLSELVNNKNTPEKLKQTLARIQQYFETEDNNKEDMSALHFTQGTKEQIGQQKPIESVAEKKNIETSIQQLFRKVDTNFEDTKKQRDELFREITKEYENASKNASLYKIYRRLVIAINNAELEEQYEHASDFFSHVEKKASNKDVAKKLVQTIAAMIIYEVLRNIIADLEKDIKDKNSNYQLNVVHNIDKLDTNHLKNNTLTGEDRENINKLRGELIEISGIKV